MYSEFWRRAGAYTIDILLLMIFFAPFNIITFSYFKEHKDIIIGVYVVLIYTLYFSILESSSRQATVGKIITCIYVIDINGNKITFWRAMIRYLLKMVSSIILFFGFIMAIFTTKNQCLHDKICGTLVLKR